MVSVAPSDFSVWWVQEPYRKCAPTIVLSRSRLEAVQFMIWWFGSGLAQFWAGSESKSSQKTDSNWNASPFTAHFSKRILWTSSVPIFSRFGVGTLGSRFGWCWVRIFSGNALLKLASSTTAKLFYYWFVLRLVTARKHAARTFFPSGTVQNVKIPPSVICE